MFNQTQATQNLDDDIDNTTNHLSNEASPVQKTVESSGYKLLGISDILQQPVDVGWLVEDLIPLQSVGMVFGASGLGKSHIMLSMAVNVAKGSSWFGKEVEQGSVAVLVGEGAGGINKRLQAIAKTYDLDLESTPITFSETPIGLDSDKGYATVEKVLDALTIPPKLIIVDTLSRHISESKENDNGDMAKFINQLDRLKQRYNATVIFVHHTGKGEQETARGAYALKANVDFSFAVKSGGGKKLALFECDKMKDGDDEIQPLKFKVIGVELGKNDKGKAITGACVVAANDVEFTLPTIQLNHTTKLALETFDTDESIWREAFINGYPNAEATRESRVKAFSREVKKLIDSGKLVKNEDGSYRNAD